MSDSTVLYGVPPMDDNIWRGLPSDGAVSLYACPAPDPWVQPPGTAEPLPSPDEMKRIALEAGPTDGELLRKAIRRFVLEPWEAAKLESEIPDLLKRLRCIVNSTPSSLVKMVDHADATEKEKAAAKAEVDAAEKELLRAKEKLEGMKP